MKPKSPKLACTASGMSFEAWKRRPVFKVHCYTFDIARQLCGVRRRPGEGFVRVHGKPDAQGLVMFRALAPFRTCASQQMRNRVAQHVRALRRELQTMV